MKSGGYMGRILEVDLTRKEIAKRPLEEDMAREYIGGRGFTSRILYEMVGPGVDPLGPENVFIFGLGPLVGTLAPAACRWSLAAKSPLTGILGDGCGGGFFGAELKRAGYDAVIIKGKAPEPVYLWIKDDEVTIRDARHLWGKDVYELERAIRCELLDPAVRIAAIGPGGENLVRYATILGDRARGAGRCGMGAVMGSKNLKAVVARGTKPVRVEKPKDLLRNAREFKEAFFGGAKAGGYEWFVNYGTPGKAIHASQLGILATRNFQLGEFEGIEKIRAEALVDRFYVKRRSCFSCPIACNQYFIGDEDDLSKVYYGTKVEFSATGHLGSMCANSDLNSILKINTLANKLGIDVISLGSTIAFAMECYEKGLITQEDTDGIDLRWGNTQAMLELAEKVGRREGFGDLLAEGSMRVARRIGPEAEDFVVHVKGMEPPDNDPRGLYGWGLGYAVASRGGDHMRAAPGIEFGTMPPEKVEALFGTAEAANRFSPVGKGKVVKWFEEIRAIQDALGICKSSARGQTARPEAVVTLYNAVTGLDLDSESLMKIGERIVNLERLYNVREGIGRKDDTLPKRFLKETLPAGLAKGRTVDLEPMLDEYYSERGWDVKTGIPTPEKLKELGLE